MSWSALYSDQPVTDCPNHDSSQIVAMTITSEFEYSRVRTPPARAHRGASGRACSPSSSSLVGLAAARSLGHRLDSGEPRWTNHTVSRM